MSGKQPPHRAFMKFQYHATAVVLLDIGSGSLKAGNKVVAMWVQ
jgi:hypothetical protein